MTTEIAPYTEEGSFRELTVGGRGVTISPPPEFYHLVPMPQTTRTKKIKVNNEWEEQEVPYFVETKIFSQPTPKHERKRHFKGYPYTTADFSRKQLNKAFDYGRWSWHETDFVVGREYKMEVGKNKVIKTYKEVMAEGYLLCPGYPPIKGIGSAPWAQDDVDDPRFSLVTAHKAAVSLALKDAAKRGFGIGADVAEDEGSANYITGTQTTCVNLFKQLVAMSPEKKKAAVKIATMHAPHAIAGDTLTAESIDEGVMDALLTDLTAEVMR